MNGGCAKTYGEKISNAANNDFALMKGTVAPSWSWVKSRALPTIEEDLGPWRSATSCSSPSSNSSVEQHLPCCRSLRGRPQQDRAALARAFIAKAAFRIVHHQGADRVAGVVRWVPELLGRVKPDELFVERASW